MKIGDMVAVDDPANILHDIKGMVHWLSYDGRISLVLLGSGEFGRTVMYFPCDLLKKVGH